MPHPLYPPLLTGEGEEKERGASPLLNARRGCQNTVIDKNGKRSIIITLDMNMT
jgi:hypothetical protein